MDSQSWPFFARAFKRTRRAFVAAASAAFLATASLVVAVGANVQPAAASSGPFTSTVVTTHSSPHVICRANGGALAANKESDQDLGYSVTHPRDVHQGDTFDLKIVPDLSRFPLKQSTGVLIIPQASVYSIWGSSTGYQLPAGLTINNVSLSPTDGNVEANPAAGYYVSEPDVPDVTTNTYDVGPDPAFDPLTLPASKRLPIPGVAPDAYWNTSTNRVYLALLGSNVPGTATDGEFRGGSVMQAPTLTINVTATANPGTHLDVTLAGSLPAGDFAATQPGNFKAPGATAALASTPATAPWASTDGLRWVYNNGNLWVDPTYTTTATAAAGPVVNARAACAPGWEPTAKFPSPPAYYTGPNALPNGTSPVLSDTVVTPYIETVTPFEGARYTTGQSLAADYNCWASVSEHYDSCVGDVADGANIDMTPGDHTFTINGTDANNAPLQTVVHYSVADNTPPVASAGAPQTGVAGGALVKLDGSGSSDADGPPAQSLTYTWAQVADGAPTVTLSDVHAIKPTFNAPAVTNGAGYTASFTLTVDDGAGGVTTSAPTSVTVAASTPTVVVAKARPGGGTTFYPGDDVTLSATITNPDGTNPADYTYAWTQTGGRTTALSSTTDATPTFRMPSSGAAPTTAACTSGVTAVSPTNANCPTYSVVVTKNNTGKSSTNTALVAYAASLPTRPVATAPNQTFTNAGGAVTLDGSTSTQAQGHAISYAWTQTGGPAVSLSSTTDAKPTFTAPAGGTAGAAYTFSLTVVDTQSPITGTGANGNTSTATTTTVTVVPDHVVAIASATPASPTAASVVTLDGSASTDPNLAPLTYSWTQVDNGAPTVALSDATAAKPTFTPPAVTTPSGYVFQFNLTVTNGGPNPGDTATTAAPLSVTVSPATPTVLVTKARDGGGTAFFTGDKITLGATITNADGNAEADYAYAWSQLTGITTTLSSLTAAHPTFIVPPNVAAACIAGTTAGNCPRFQVVVTKTNTGKSSVAAPLAVWTSTLATRPVANAADQTADIGGATATVNGSASTQAQGHPIAFTWSQTDGPPVVLSDVHAASPTFPAPSAPTTYTFSLVVNDTQNPIAGSGTNGNTSLADTAVVTYKFQSPVISAGDDQSLHAGNDTVTLHGTASQLNDHNLTYAWTQAGGPAVTLSDASVLQPTFTEPNNGPADLTFTLSVTDNDNPDGALNTSSDTTVVHVANGTPVASAGPDTDATANETVTLDGTGSSDPDGDALTYLWEQTAGPSVTLADPTAVTTTFTAPATLESLDFKLTVDDGHGLTASDTVRIDNGNTVPVADAGDDQTKLVASSVTLDGSGSSDADPGQTLQYTWSQTGGTAVTLSDAHAVTPTFTAPSAPSDLTFELLVDDGVGGTATDTVTVHVINHTPTANAGPDQADVTPNTTATLDGSGSSDPDAGQTLTYNWSQTGGPSVALSDLHAASPTFTVPVGPATLTFQLVVSDGYASSTADSVNIGVAGVAGLDLQAWLAGAVRPGAKSTGFTLTVKNVGTLSQALTQANVHPVVLLDGDPVPAAQVKQATRSITLAHGKGTGFHFTWKPVVPLGAGHALHVSACVDVPGDFYPANNCGSIDQTDGPTALSIAPTYKAIGANAKPTVFVMRVGNVSKVAFSVSPADVSLSISVNGGSAITLPGSGPTVLLAPGHGTADKRTWNHAALHVGDAVTRTTCAGVTGQPGPICSSYTVIVK